MKRLVGRSRKTGARDLARNACFIALGPMILGACDSSERMDDRVVRTDSAGVTTVHYSSLPSLEESRIAISPEPDLIIGHEGTEPAYEFFRIAGVARVADGSLVIADEGSLQLRVFNSEGRFVRSTGEQGDGPGEFRTMGGFWVTGGDSLVVWDGAAHRLTLLSPRGEFVRVARMAETSFTEFLTPTPKGVLRDGRVVAVFPSPPRPSGGMPQRQPQLLAFTTLDDDQWDSVRVIAGPEQLIEAVGDGISMTAHTFGAYPFAAAAASSVAVVDAAEFRIELYDTDGRLSAIISASLPDIAVTSEVLDAHIERSLEQWPPGMSDQARESFRQRVRNGPRASVLPKIRAVVVDAEDRIWVERFDLPGSRTSRWEVFERDGTWVGRIGMPEGFARGTAAVNAPGFFADSERVAGVWVDPETGVETVRVYRIQETER